MSLTGIYLLLSGLLSYSLDSCSSGLSSHPDKRVAHGKMLAPLPSLTVPDPLWKKSGSLSKVPVMF